MKRCITFYSEKTDEKEAFEEVCSKIEAELENPILILFFSNCHSFPYFAENIHSRFPKSETMGTTTYHHFASKGDGNRGFSAMAIFSGIDVNGGVLHEVGTRPITYAGKIVASYRELCVFAEGEINGNNTCCIEFTTALTNGEELVLDTFDEVLSEKGINVYGSSGGMADGEEGTLVALNGMVYEDSCVYMMIHNRHGRIVSYKENIYKPTKYCFTATDVNCDKRIIYELDNRPAVTVLQEVFDVPREDLTGILHNHHIGRMADDNIFITEVQDIGEDDSLSCFTQVYNMTRMVLLELDDMESVWRDTRINVERLVQHPSFSIMINCMGRTKVYEQEGKINAFVETVQKSYPNLIGVAGLGEQMGNVHLNQSMVLVLFE